METIHPAETPPITIIEKAEAWHILPRSGPPGNRLFTPEEPGVHVVASMRLVQPTAFGMLSIEPIGGTIVAVGKLVPIGAGLPGSR